MFEKEPTPDDNPILKLDNVIVSPHALCWTEEMFRNIARSGLNAGDDAENLRRPEFLVSQAVVKHPRVVSRFHHHDATGAAISTNEASSTVVAVAPADI